MKNRAKSEKNYTYNSVRNYNNRILKYNVKVRWAK